MAKYRNKRTEVDGLVFASQKEALRYQELKLLERAGEIFNLMWQRPFQIEVNGVKICKYVADFTYSEKGGWYVTEDIKSDVTRKLPAYRLKKKLMLAVHGIEIREV